MATLVMGATAPSFQPRAGYPSDYYDLVRELSATETAGELRRWAIDNTARRAALPREAQAQLRAATIHQQQLVRGDVMVELPTMATEPFRTFHARRQAARDALRSQAEVA